jgi:HK97 family phage portal protein
LNLLDRIVKPKTERRFSLQDWVELFTFNGQQYSVPQTFHSWRKGEEGPAWGFPGLATSGLSGSGVVFACFAARMHVFSQIRYQFQQLRNGRPGDFFGTTALSPLERPWVGGTTGNLNSRMLVFADLAGNAYVTPNSRGELRLLRPDWVTILAAGSDPDDIDGVDAQIAAYIYKPGGPAAQTDPVFLSPEKVAHFAPYPDPQANWRGMSWLTPVIRNVAAHKSATTYKEKFFVNGATPNAIVKVDPNSTYEFFKDFREDFLREYEGVHNSHKTWFLGGGADATIVGSSFDEMNFDKLQSADEVQICAAAGVPLSLVGLGGTATAGSALNSGNYESAKRQFADTTIQHLGQEAAASLETLIGAPTASRLWFDTRDISFFRQDEQSEAEVRSKDAITIRQLIDAGYTAESIVAALAAADWSLLQHSGLFSVQLQPPGQSQPVSVA